MTEIGSVSSNYSSTTTQVAQRPPETSEVKGASETDGDSDDGGTQAAAPAPAPIVNMSGQKIGQLINVSA